jgi:isopentenyl-diphosphate delta-isomerase
MGNINQRKRDHIDIVSAGGTIDRRQNYFDRIHLTHRALPGLDLSRVDPAVKFMGKELSFPLVISSMTGGSDFELIKINRNLAKAAEAEGVALAVGSQRILFSDAMARDSFDLRAYAPNTLLFGNLGAVQLNYEMGFADCEAAVKILDADGLYLHLNPLQEAVQPEGDTDFSSLRSKIAGVFPRRMWSIFWRRASNTSILPDAAERRGAWSKADGATNRSWANYSPTGGSRPRWPCG